VAASPYPAYFQCRFFCTYSSSSSRSGTARQLATKRVVVKRPDYAPPLADVATTNAVTTKGHRFDIYSGTPE